MPDEFLLSYVSFDDDNRPFIDVEVDGEISRLPILGEDLALAFDKHNKFCTGWVDFENRCSVACPDGAAVEPKYENCLKCRNRTGFNPAFYHASSVSEQQEKINAKPHFVYLAYFAPEVLKVGISQESRGLRRILEQGARLALKLETFPSALIARQYEEKISRSLAAAEHVSASKKLELLKLPFDKSAAEKSLSELKSQTENLLNINFANAKLIDTEEYFFAEKINPTDAINMTDDSQIAGRVLAAIGSVIITDWQSNLLAYNLKRFVGYRARRVRGQIDIELPSEQMALF